MTVRRVGKKFTSPDSDNFGSCLSSPKGFMKGSFFVIEGGNHGSVKLGERHYAGVCRELAYSTQLQNLLYL